MDFKYSKYGQYFTVIKYSNLNFNGRKECELTFDGINFSALITLVQTFKSTFGLNNKIQNTAMAIAYLKKEKLLFETKTTPYDQDQEENMHMLAQILPHGRMIFWIA
ncbi:Uncharacterised protein [Weissella viridescens]|uniref:Uncharacterized protein n=1 Tax=Weissella viridescens TaxID=1629 RepID=A0A380NZ69_WEIVI|nr:Uncharacterised protein [Weissella viridescens]